MAINHETPSWVWKRRREDAWVQHRHEVSIPPATMPHNILDRIAELELSLLDINNRLAAMQEKLRLLEARIEDLTARPVDPEIQRRPRDWGAG